VRGRDAPVEREVVGSVLQLAEIDREAERERVLRLRHGDGRAGPADEETERPRAQHLGARVGGGDDRELGVVEEHRQVRRLAERQVRNLARPVARRRRDEAARVRSHARRQRMSRRSAHCARHVWRARRAVVRQVRTSIGHCGSPSAHATAHGSSTSRQRASAARRVLRQSARHVATAALSPSRSQFRWQARDAQAAAETHPVRAALQLAASAARGARTRHIRGTRRSERIGTSVTLPRAFRFRQGETAGARANLQVSGGRSRRDPS
jgi:hypothetical protein